MCDYISRQSNISEDAIEAFKIVRVKDSNFNKFGSEYTPDMRTELPNRFEFEEMELQGQDLVYIRGEVTHSPSGPGIMCYAARHEAIRALRGASFKLISVTIPPDTRYRWGVHGEYGVLLAEKVLVGELLLP